MAIRIYNNIPALTSQRYLSQTNSDMTKKNLERLSSGLRINSASDDASGLAISEKTSWTDIRTPESINERSGRYFTSADSRRRSFCNYRYGSENERACSTGR